MIIDKPFNGIYEGKDVEVEVRQYMQQLLEYTDGLIYLPEDRVRKKIDIPEKYDYDVRSKEFKMLDYEHRKEISNFWKETKRRMREGYDGMAPLQYGYFNFGKFNGGKGELKYRRADNNFHWLINACRMGDNERFQGYKGHGVIEVGRRRSGKSSKIGWYVNSIGMTVRNTNIIVSSKDEKSAEEQLIDEKIRFQYEALPMGIKPSQLRTNAGMVHFGIKGKDQAGNRKTKGRNVKVMSRAPKAESLEGFTLSAWIHDEAPKTPNLFKLVKMTLPALNDAEGFKREGFVYLTGVAGDFGKFGEDFKILWASYKRYKLVRWFSAGWYGLCCDEYGNEDVEAAVRMILEERHAIINNPDISPSQREEDLYASMQQFPLTIEEAFQTYDSSCKFPEKKIKAQIKYLETAGITPTPGRIGWQVPKILAEFTPTNINANTFVLEEPQVGAKYISGMDCYGLKQNDMGSDGVQWIYKMENMTLTPLEKEFLYNEYYDTDDPKERLRIHLELGDMFVAMHRDRQRNPKTFADSGAALASWYQRISGDIVRVLPETEPSNIIDYLMTEYPMIVMNEPIRPDRIPTAAYLKRMGINMKGYWADKRLGEISSYIDNYAERCYWIMVLKKMLRYDETIQAKKFDEIDAMGVTLIMKTDPRIKAWVTRGLNKKIDVETFQMNKLFKRH